MEYVDNDLGHIKLVANAKARRIIARMRDGQLQITHPPLMSRAEIEKVLHDIKPDLVRLKIHAKEEYVFVPDMEFATHSFVVRIQENRLNNFYTRFSSGILSISYPYIHNHKDDIVQSFVRNVVEKTMRSEAKRLFPSKVQECAQAFNFSYSDVKINKSESRWGSCSSKKAINLSYYCLLLPEHLINFVIQHELCHTVEMNHGNLFWSLLDKVSGGNARKLTKELKQYQTRW